MVAEEWETKKKGKTHVLVTILFFCTESERKHVHVKTDTTKNNLVTSNICYTFICLEIDTYGA